MRRIALVTIEKSADERKDILGKTLSVFRNLINGLIPNKIEIINIDEEITLYVIKIFIKENTIRTKLEKIFKYISKQQIDAVAFDQCIIDNCYADISDFIRGSGIYLSEGRSIEIPVAINTLKKILKAKGYSLGDIDAAVVSKGNSYYTKVFIRHLSNQVKYLTYVCNEENSNINALIDDIFKNQGVSIRTCSNLNQCINETNLIINITKTNIAINKLNPNKVIIYNIENSLNIESVPQNVSILNNILIDTERLVRLPLNNKMKYKLCEMYILSRLDKIYLLNHELTEADSKIIYEYFKNSGFGVTGLDGINI